MRIVNCENIVHCAILVERGILRKAKRHSRSETGKGKRVERLTVALQDGQTAQLRKLAGGERKVGRLLDNVIQWLWLHRETLSDCQDIASFVPVRAQALSEALAAQEMLNERMPELEERLSEALTAQETLNERVPGLEARLEELEKIVERTAERFTMGGAKQPE